MKKCLWLVCLLVAVLTIRAAPDSPAPAGKQMRLAFKAYDGNPKNTNDYSKFSFQIDTIDLRQPSEFLQLGQMIPNTKFKLLKFVFKEKRNQMTGEMDDVSELTIANKTTGQTAVLIFNMVVDVSPIDPR